MADRFLEHADPMPHDAKLKMPEPLWAPLKRLLWKLELHRLQQRRSSMEASEPERLWRA